MTSTSLLAQSSYQDDAIIVCSQSCTFKPMELVCSNERVSIVALAIVFVQRTHTQTRTHFDIPCFFQNILDYYCQMATC